ncbi:lipase family protein [Flaviaesturariibacter amylovorans]|uniref:Fungal lipase-type domain-containing protein n=1 Tax=Flaviaesturariibacter amylovorans TaxID=1084520 RepID=A0ABP8GG88_9BACT
MKKTLFLAFLLASACCAVAQEALLRPGFDAREYRDLLAMNFNTYDSLQRASGEAVRFRRTYTSRVTGLDNRWFLWQAADAPVAVLCIRGTVATKWSWLANLYSEMQPAAGTLQLDDSTRVDYRLAAAEGAAVHTGWLIALASMSGDIERKIRELYDKGTRAIYVTGHSQGGVLAALLRSWLHYRTLQGALPAGITYKTYSSAGPKPGNLQFAYDYDFINRGGWAFNVVNAADWVPETPLSLQQIRDLNPNNPLADVKGALRNQKLVVRLYGAMMYNKLTRKSRKAVGKYQKYFGGRVGKEVRKKLPALRLPGATPGLDYMRAGGAVVLMPDSAYYRQYPNDTSGLGVWKHHTFGAYLTLLRKDYLQP